MIISNSKVAKLGTCLAIFCFNRPKQLLVTLKAIEKHGPEMFEDCTIFCDGPRNTEDSINISEVERVIDEFVTRYPIKLIKSDVNIGLRNSIVNGLNFLFEKYDSVIVLEDDIVITQGFVQYHKKMLVKYKADKEVFSISGFSYPLALSGGQFFKFQRICSWGWSTWADRWHEVDWEKRLPLKAKLLSKSSLSLCKGGIDLYVMLLKSKFSNFSNSAWTVDANLYISSSNCKVIYPTNSYTYNAGHDLGTHATGMRVMNAPLNRTKELGTEILGVKPFLAFHIYLFKHYYLSYKLKASKVISRCFSS